jgi:hypothetical protein
MVKTSLLFALFASFGCKPPQSDSSLQDAATTKNFKSGFFTPKLKSEYALTDAELPISVKAFVAEARKITGTRDLKLSGGSDRWYGVTTNSSKEQVLLLMSADDVPTPVLSIKGGNLYSWAQSISSREGGKTVLVNELFIKYPFGATNDDFTPNDMYVRRMAYNSGGYKEPVLIPWLNHVRSETAGKVAYRLGNTIVDAGSGVPILEFRRLKDQPAWYIVGSYKDEDVQLGTVFWRQPGNQDNFISLSPHSKIATLWKKQDNDSIDRLKSVPTDKIEIPAIVQDFLNSLEKSGSEHPAKKMSIAAFDWFDGDGGVFQLNRNSLTIVGAKGALALSSNDNQIKEKTEFIPEDYVKGFAFWPWSSSNQPVQTHNTGQGFKSAVWTDANGEKRSGAMVSERNVWQPGGAFSSGKYEKHYYVLNRTSNEYAEVKQDGTVVRDNISSERFRSMMETNINMAKMQQEGGSVDKKLADARKLGERAERQIERSQSLRPGDTVGEMASNLTKDAAVTTAKWTAIDAAGQAGGPAAQMAVITITNTLQERSRDGTPGEHAVRLGEQILTDSAYVVSEKIAKSTGVNGNVTDGVTDVLLEAQQRVRQGDFDTSNPDYYFDSQVSGGRIAGRAVDRVSRYVTTNLVPNVGGLQAAASTAQNQLLDNGLFGTTEALSRDIHSNTLLKEQENTLEEVSQLRRDSESSNQALENMKRFEQLDSVSSQLPQPNPADVSISQPIILPVP